MLSTTATHALRAMTALAHAADQPVLAREISAACDVPVPYLSKILSTLTRAGLVVAVRGPGGGYRLGRPAQAIRLVDVVVPFDSVRAQPGCFFEPTRPCNQKRSCCAHDRWEHVRRVFVDFLETTTLSELSKSDESRLPVHGLPVSCFASAPRRVPRRLIRGRVPERGASDRSSHVRPSR